MTKTTRYCDFNGSEGALEFVYTTDEMERDPVEGRSSAVVETIDLSQVAFKVLLVHINDLFRQGTKTLSQKEFVKTVRSMRQKK